MAEEKIVSEKIVAEKLATDWGAAGMNLFVAVQHDNGSIDETEDVRLVQQATIGIMQGSEEFRLETVTQTNYID